MAKKDKNKKGEDVLQIEMKAALEKEIAKLEADIFLEQQKIIYSQKQFLKRRDEMDKEVNEIEDLRKSEDDNVKIENDSLIKTEKEYKNEVRKKEESIQILDDKNTLLEKKIRDKEIENKKELEEKDKLISDLRTQFEDMSVRFQHILQRTANKLQERVDMGR